MRLICTSDLATCFSSLLHGALSAALEAEKSTATSLHNTVNAARILAQAKVYRRPGSGFVLQSRKVLEQAGSVIACHRNSR